MAEGVNRYGGFERHDLDGTHTFYTGRLPEGLTFDPEAFESLWRMRPAEYHKIRIAGRVVSTPRWQQAYGVDYYYTGRVNRALPVPPVLDPLLVWARETIDERLNGILVNWYDGSLRHYIGRHRDSIRSLIVGVPIVTYSFGEGRVFRLRPLQGTGHKDFFARHGDVFIMPSETNLAWTHEVPHFSRFRGKRISVTLRGFIPGRLRLNPW
jgi:alkylated DNA repair dioxygenase AlkB